MSKDARHDEAINRDHRLLLFDGISKAIASIPKYLCYMICAWQGVEAIKALAGKTTYADITLPALLSMNENGGLINNKMVIILLISLFIWAISERHFRHKKTQYLTQRIADLERKLDPNRSSSLLAVSGKTNPGDR